jgi:tetratricopeptide (TPR) repeat protein
MKPRRSPVPSVVLLLFILAGGCAALLAGSTFDRAVDAFERGDYRGAATLLESSLAGKSGAPRERILLGWSYYKLGDQPRAKAEFDRALKTDPNDPNAFYAHEGLGWVGYKSGAWDAALAAFAESLRLRPGYHNAHDGLGWVYLAKGDLVRAETNFKHALDRMPGDPDARRGLGFVAYRRGDWKLTIDRMRQVLRDNEGDTLTRSALGWAHFFAGDPATARQVFQDVARREPTWADPLLGLGWVAEREGRRQDAKASFHAALEKSATYVVSADEKVSLRKLVTERSDWVDLWRDLGWALYQERSFALADKEFTALLARHVDDADGLRGLGYTLYMLKRYRDAIPPLERSLATGQSLPPVKERVEIPGTPGLHEITSDARSTLAWAYYQVHDLQMAAKLFREVTAREPGWPDPWSGLGWVLTGLGDRAEAERAFRRSLQARPGYPDALAGLRSLGKAER